MGHLHGVPVGDPPVGVWVVPMCSAPWCGCSCSLGAIPSQPDMQWAHLEASDFSCRQQTLALTGPWGFWLYLLRAPGLARAEATLRAVSSWAEDTHRTQERTCLEHGQETQDTGLAQDTHSTLQDIGKDSGQLVLAPRLLCTLPAGWVLTRSMC